MAQKKPIYMESTEIPAERTAADVSSCLVQAGATSVSVRYDAGKVVGMSWTIGYGVRTEKRYIKLYDGCPNCVWNINWFA